MNTPELSTEQSVHPNFPAGTVVDAVQQLDAGEALIAGVVDGFISVACFVGKTPNGLAARIVEYAVLDPVGVTFGAFGAACLVQAGLALRAKRD